MIRYCLALFFAVAVTDCVAEEPCQTIPGCPWEQSQTVILNLLAPDCQVEVIYVRRTCNGVTDVFIKDYRVMDGCGGGDELILYQYSYSGFMDYISLALLASVPVDELPNCPSGTPYVASVYTSSCGSGFVVSIPRPRRQHIRATKAGLAHLHTRWATLR